MLVRKKKINKPKNKRMRKTKNDKIVVVTKTVISADESLFPEKLKKVNEMVSKAKFIEK